MHVITRLVPVALAAMVALSLVLPAAAAVAADLRIGSSAEVTSVDPHFHNLAPNNNLAAHVFEPLVRFDGDYRLQPALAESWRRVDDLTWEFRLRPGARFHDGTEVTADDVVWSIERTGRIEKSPGPFTVYTRQITGREAVDRRTVRLRTAVPYPLMLNDLSAIFIVSRAATQGLQSADLDAGRGVVGSGPFRLQAFRSKETVDLVRNDAYDGPLPAWQRVQFRMLTTAAARVAALKSGQVDLIDGVPPADVADLRRHADFRTVGRVANRIIFLMLSQAQDDNPYAAADGGGPYLRDAKGQPLARNPLRDARVRLAISKAINRSAITERVIDGLGVPAGDLVPPPMFGHLPSLRPEAFDPDGARRLLAEAGYADGFRLTLHGPNNRYINDAQVLQAIAQMLARIGLVADVRAEPAAAYFGRANRGDYPVALAGWGAQTGEVSSTLRAILATRNPAKGFGAFNGSGYSSRRVDALLEDALQTVDDAKRERLLQDAVAQVVADLGVVPLHFQMATWAMRRGIGYAARMDERTMASQVTPAP